MHRRRFLQVSATTGVLAGLAGVGADLRWAHATQAAGTVANQSHTRDWAWLTGRWDVRHRRLRERLVGNQDWEQFPGESTVWPTLGGLGNLDDNIVALPAGSYRGVSLRAYDPATDHWAIWWLDGRNPTRIDPPVSGRFEGDTGIFTGHDTLRGKPILMRFTWRAVHGPQPWWEQAFSGDAGRTWEVNWQNWFTRTAQAPSPLATLPDAPHDWDALQGRWQLHGRRLRDPSASAGQWEDFSGTLANWPLLGGHGHFSDLALRTPAGDEHVLWMHTRDPQAGQWLAWQLDAREPARIDPPTRGVLAGNRIAFTGDARVGARHLPTRTVWHLGGAGALQREQAVSFDGGAHWIPSWTAELTRAD